MRRTWFCMLVACAPSVASAQGTQAPEAAIREHQAALAAAINRRDAAALALLFTADGDEINVDGPRTGGRDAIRAATQRELATWPSARRFTLEVTVQLIEHLGDVVYAHGVAPSGAALTARAPHDTELHAGSTALLSFAQADVLVFDAAGRAIWRAR